MALKKIKIGSFVELYKETCNIPNLTVNDVSGINKDKEFFEPSKQVGADTSKYKVVPPDYFACNFMHVVRDVVLPVSINRSQTNKIVSQAYTVFCINDESQILREYFYILLNSSERDRYFWFHTDSSVRDGLDWSIFCDLEISVPDIDIQRKFVKIYHGLYKNIIATTKSIDEMQNTCNAYMAKLLKQNIKRPIGDFIEELDERNSDDAYKLDDVRGISIDSR